MQNINSQTPCFFIEGGEIKTGVLYEFAQHAETATLPTGTGFPYECFTVEGGYQLAHYLSGKWCLFGEVFSTVDEAEVELDTLYANSIYNNCGGILFLSLEEAQAYIGTTDDEDEEF